MERIAFSRTAPGAGVDIWVVPIGRAPVRLTTHPRPDYFPAFNPDGTKIAFSTEREIPRPAVYQIDIRGAGESRMFFGQRENQVIVDLRWSADGARMAYTLDDGIWLRDLITGRDRRVTPEGVHASWPAFGPDGIYFRRRTGTGAIQIWRIDPASGAMSRVLGVPDGADQPAWTRDGTAMFFRFEGNIERVDRGFSGRRIVVTNGAEPAPSPSGRNLAFVRGGAIWTATSDGASQAAATTGPGDARPTWGAAAP